MGRALHTVGEVLPNGATVTSVDFDELGDGTTVETMRATYPNGAHDDTITTTHGEGTPHHVQQNLIAKTQDALAVNAAFTANPENFDAQVLALTRQVNALIRLTHGQFDTLDGT